MCWLLAIKVEAEQKPGQHSQKRYMCSKVDKNFKLIWHLDEKNQFCFHFQKHKVPPPKKTMCIMSYQKNEIKSLRNWILFCNMQHTPLQSTPSIFISWLMSDGDWWYLYWWYQSKSTVQVLDSLYSSDLTSVHYFFPFLEILSKLICVYLGVKSAWRELYCTKNKSSCKNATVATP